MNYEYLFRLVNEAFDEECHARFTIKEDYSNTIFPRIEISVADGQKTYMLLFNRKIEAVLSLFNAAFVFGIDSTELIAQYLMVQESIDADEYEYAESFLEALRDNLRKLELVETFKEHGRNIKMVTALQVLYILFHEISHEAIKNDPRLAEMGLHGSKIIVNEMLEEFNEGFTEEHFEELSQNEFVREVCKDFLPDDASEEDLQEFVMEYLRNVHVREQSVGYLHDLLNGSDDSFLNEMACDRNAYRYMMRWLLPAEKYKDEVTGFLLMAYMGLLAMDYSSVFQSYSRVYDDIEDRIHLQQRSVLRNRNMLNSITKYVDGVTDEAREMINDTEMTISHIIVNLAHLAHGPYAEVIEHIREKKENSKDTQIRKELALKKECDEAMAGVLSALEGELPAFFTNIPVERMRGHWLINGLQKIAYSAMGMLLKLEELKK